MEITISTIYKLIPRRRMRSFCTGIRTLIFILIFCFDPVASFAQDQNFLWYHQLNETEGLTLGEFNYYVYHDSEGFVWVSSTDGLNRFDGQTVMQYRSDIQDSTTLYGNNIQSNFFEDPQQNIWFCTYRAIHCYDRQQGHFQHYFVKDKAGKNIEQGYQVFHLEKDRYLWLRNNTTNNIYRLDIQNPEVYQIISQTAYYHSFLGQGEEQKSYLFSMDNKLAGFEFTPIDNGVAGPKEKKKYFDAIDQVDVEFHQVFFEDLENIWLTSNIGLIKWNARTDTFEVKVRKRNDYCQMLVRDQETFILSFFTDELYSYHRTTDKVESFQLKSIKDPIAPFRFVIRNLYLDQDQTIWMTTGAHGLLYANPQKNKFKLLPKTQIPKLNSQSKFNMFLRDQHDQIWCAYEKGILTFQPNGKLNKHYLPGMIHPKDSFIVGILNDQEHRIWVATSQAILVKPAAAKKFQAIDVNTFGFLYLYQLKNQRILVSSVFGLFEITSNDQGWHTKKLFIKDQAPAPYTSIYEDRLGQIYACNSETHIDLFSIQGDTLFLKNKLPISGAINAYHEAEEQNLWIASSAGLFKINKNQPSQIIQNFRAEDGLPNDHINSILPKSKEELWLGTNKGLCIFNTKNYRVQSYSLADGMLSNSFEKYAAVKSSSGAFWFGGKNGITIIPKQLPEAAKITRKILITALQINNKPYKDATEQNANQVSSLSLPYQKNTISFDFTLTDYSAPKDIQLRYKMQGIDPTWIKVKKGAAASVAYPQIRHGNYTFLIEGLDHKGEVNISRTIELSIQPPIWATWQFRVLVLLLLSLLIAGFVQLRIRKIKRVAALETQRVKEISRLETQMANDRVSTLIAQMNPHFIFNSLNSINRYLLRQGNRAGSSHLTDFSTFMRTVLNSSRDARPYHKLSTEIDFLEKYLKLEKLRLEHPFSYTIDIEAAIDQSITLIPKVMLQPLIENAIEHGVSKLDGQREGHIQITIRKKDTLLQCTVEDNGVGRVSLANQDEMQRPKVHKSVASAIIKERLKLFFPDQQALCAIHYTDLLDETARPIGTRVDLSMPFEVRSVVSYSEIEH